jgi:hypothetical protein
MMQAVRMHQCGYHTTIKEAASMQFSSWFIRMVAVAGLTLGSAVCVDTTVHCGQAVLV